MEEYWILEDETDEDFQAWRNLFKKMQEEPWNRSFREFRGGHPAKEITIKLNRH